MSTGSAATPPSPPRISVVVPTHERRAAVVAHLQAFEQQRYEDGFEVVVVDDGSRDGTAAALRALAPRFPLQVLEQPHAGAAAARNHGARAARGDLLLFLDDDMEPDPGLLAAHDRRHREGADAVVGHMPVHAATPPSFLARGSRHWVEHRRATLSGATAPLPGSNFLTGQASVSRRWFERIGGFDEAFNRAGSYGREDTDFGLRLERAGGRLVYEPEAISHQRLLVTPRRYLARQRQLGRANVALLRKHPDLPEFVVKTNWRLGRFDRWIGRWLAPLVTPPLFALFAAGLEHRRLERLFFWVTLQRYWRGVRDAGGYPERRPLRVLAYHAVRDLTVSPALARYGTPLAQLRRQLDVLRRAGFRPISPAELLAYLESGAGVPRGAVLLSFDDAYAEVADDVLPLLAEHGASAVVFAVSARIGGVNDWESSAGAPRLVLCDAERLRALAAAGCAIGAHSRTHCRLDRLPPDALADELAGAADELAANGLPRPRLLAYPYGVADERVVAAAREAGYTAAFTARPGRVTPASDPLALPRIEIFRRDRGWRFLLKVASAGEGLRGVWATLRGR
jgi:GT2 family glycosyltransferase/peptidoglycan/xylan/chitin deacetylase (PgdA/CDA1 family)